MKAHATLPDPKTLLLNRFEAASKLTISVRTLAVQTALGNIPVVRIGGAVRYRESALESFIESNEIRLTAKRRR